MTPYKLSDKDYTVIYQAAVRQFKESAMHSVYENFLTICILDNFISYLKSNNLVVVNGKVYVATKTEEG